MQQLDHIVIAVPSLAKAREDFTRAGFTVTSGGRHDELPTENALIPFADGTYLELLAARDPDAREEWRTLAAGPGWARHLRGVSAIARRFLPSLAGPDGVVDWCLGDADLAGVAMRLRRSGHVAAGPFPMMRERHDGERVEWSLLLPESRLLPFWIRDRTPRDRRVPEVPGPHPNGAIGLAAIRIRTPSVALAALALGDMFDSVPEADPNGARLSLGAWHLEVAPGVPEGIHAVEVQGCAALPDDVRALGVLPAHGA